MIKFIMNGFPRSGTTFMYWLMKKSNPSMVHLIEPLHEDIVKIDKIKNKTIKLHGKKVNEDYGLLPRESLLKIQELRKHLKSKANVALKNFRFFYPLKIDDVSEYFDFINSIERDITLQLNKGSFILPELAERYKCNYVHVIRNPYDVWISFIKPLTNDGWKSLVRKYILMKSYGDYWDLNNFYNVLRVYDKDLPKVKNKDYLGKFLVNWIYANYSALNKMNKRGFVIKVDDFDENDLKKLEKHSGLKFDLSKVRYDRTRLLHQSLYEYKEKLKQQMYIRTKELGLKKEFEELIHLWNLN